MKKLIYSASLLLAASFLAGCETEESGRMRQGIQDPIERHPRSVWHWPFFHGSHESKPTPVRAPEDGYVPDAVEGVPPG